MNYCEFDTKGTENDQVHILVGAEPKHFPSRGMRL
jgi:hypothetical protein